MMRSEFFRRMAFCALACGFLDVRMPEIESEPEFASATDGDYRLIGRDLVFTLDHPTHADYLTWRAGRA